MGLKSLAFAAVVLMGGVSTNVVRAEDGAVGKSAAKPLAPAETTTPRASGTERAPDAAATATAQTGATAAAKASGLTLGDRLKAVIGNGAAHTDDHGALVR